ncbi:AAA family ATPase [Winogradskyella ouciana]|uniref:AAA family ATPase n=1 Tax=Winogradskyella ouciana TaxID=2608631 RepID=A0A7K1GES5_9FLAO|nr:AAA family ATPase [Winogradskyella ouciana]MTE27545.1 AAA family ATPase [Winogradskyella ouciana]
MIKWWIAFNELAKLLVEYYKINKDNSGIQLWQDLIGDADFRLNNDWFDKFIDESGINSSDPIHVFASINGNRTRDELRTKRLNIVLNILKSDITFENIDYTGCPAIVNISILSVRPLSTQKQIWIVFERIYTRGIKGLQKADFNKFKNWHGINFSSFTIFLFWIRSDSFLPIDKNTRTFLISARIIEKEPNKYEPYTAIIDNVARYNYNDNPLYDKNGIYREFTHISYLVFNKGQKQIAYSREFQKFLEDSKNKSEDGFYINLEKVEYELESKNDLKDISTIGDIGFKLIAIEPLKECEDCHLNNLKKQPYFFEKSFHLDNGVFFYDESIDNSIYDLDLGRQKLKVNITCVVGKNGSGKSTMLELFFKMINNISSLFVKELKTNDMIYVDGLAIKLYYFLNGKLFCIKILKNEVSISEFKVDSNNKIYYSGDIFRPITFSDFSNLFYTVAVNYSHYALNNSWGNDWLKELFHKNDAYQTPLVINPMRTDGNIDINIENELVKQRLIANLFQEQFDDQNFLVQVTEFQKVSQIHFEFYTRNYSKTLIAFLKQKRKRKTLLDLIYSTFKIPQTPEEIKNVIVIENQNYLIHKLVKIARVYKNYFKYFNPKTGLLKNSKTNYSNYLNAIKKDFSHITYKLRQSINYLKYYDLIKKEEKIVLDLDYFSKKLYGGYSTNFLELKSTKLIEILPPPIFKAEILLENNKDEFSSFDKLSSGEKQQIHSVSSLLYHITNLNSVNSNSLVKYRNINIILDEIELYYHPEMQRKYLFFLLKAISKLDIDDVDALNICLVTHSPYILSDIPTQFTLRLDDGTPIDDDNKTFGANIHDLLDNEFFMKDGFMGELAKEKIEETIQFLNYIEAKSKVTEKDRNETHRDSENYNNLIESFEKSDISRDRSYHLKIINLIGEPVIRYRLEDKYNEIFTESISKDIAEKRIREIAKDAGLNLNDLKE